MPAINVFVWVPCTPMRMVLASAATPALPMSILLLPVVRLLPRARTQCDIARAGGVASERTNTGGRIEIAGGVVKERITTGGRVEVAGAVVKKRITTGGRVERAERVAKKRINTVGRVVAADDVAKERINTGGCVGDAGGVVNERVLTQERVDVGPVAALLTNCSRLRRKRKADEHK